MSGKPKRKRNECPHCELGRLVPSINDNLECTICFIFFDKWTHEPLHEQTFSGQLNALRVSVKLLKQLVWQDIKSAISWVFLK